MVTKVSKNVERKDGFRQVCVWPGTIVKDEEIPDMEKFFKEKMNTRVQYLESIKTLPDKDRNGDIVSGTGNRTDVFFAVNDDDVMGFSIPRFEFGIRWIEDVLGNEEKGCSIYPERIKGYCSWDYFGKEDMFDQDKDGNASRKDVRMEKTNSGTVTGVKVKLIGDDGNAFAIIGKVKNTMRRSGVSKEIIDEYVKEAMSGDYDNLLTVTMKYVIITGSDDD